MCPTPWQPALGYNDPGNNFLLLFFFSLIIFIKRTFKVEYQRARNCRAATTKAINGSVTIITVTNAIQSVSNQGHSRETYREISSEIYSHYSVREPLYWLSLREAAISKGWRGNQGLAPSSQKRMECSVVTCLFHIIVGISYTEKAF